MFHKIIKELKERGMSYSWPWEWTRKDEVCASIHVFYDITEDELQLSYTYNGKAKKDRIKLCYLPNNYGGQRMYFYCSRCGRRIRFFVCNPKRICMQTVWKFELPCATVQQGRHFNESYREDIACSRG